MSHWPNRSPEKGTCTWVTGQDADGNDIVCGREFEKRDPRQVVCTYHAQARRRAVDAEREKRKRLAGARLPQQSSPPQESAR